MTKVQAVLLGILLLGLGGCKGTTIVSAPGGVKSIPTQKPGLIIGTGGGKGTPTAQRPRR